MKIKKLIVALMAISSAFAFAAPKANLKELPLAERIAAAKKEGTLTIYTHSSRTAKVAESFTKKYGIKVDVTQLKDGEMIEKVSKEAQANLDAADLIYCQDGSRVYPELILTGYVQNYIPSAVKGHMIDKDYEDPFVWEIMPKIFIYNNESTKTKLTNVWQLTEPAFKGCLQFKDPFTEGVNMNFFTMVTKKKVSDQLAKAYKEYYGKDIKLTTKNAGYEWIKMLYKNGAVLGSSDTKIAENVGAKGQNANRVGLFTSNKMRTAKSKNLALEIAYDMKPFCGFMYPAYAFITKNAKAVNAAMLFLEYSMTKEGWEPFDTYGDYSAVDTIMNNKEDKYTLYDWKKYLVWEDPVYCAENRSDVEEFISSLM